MSNNPIGRLMHDMMIYYYIPRIFSEIDGQLDFIETLVNGSIFNVVSINNIRSLRKSLFKKLSALKVIYFVFNSEENKTFHICYRLQEIF